MLSEFLDWKEIDAVWDVDHACTGMTAQQAYDAWQIDVADHPTNGMHGNEWDIEDFRMYTNWLNKK